MVRLKESPLQYDNIVLGFQFLMVRLKEIKKEYEEIKKEISIPYGSIKSGYRSIELNRAVGFQFLMVRLKVSITFFNANDVAISIPYGSIKSNYMKGDSAYQLISIPYGSIKRNIPVMNVACVLRFQFLMVRLKALFPKGKLLYSKNFNSLWFD